MEAIDLEILRQMYRGGRWVRWGIDPRISLQEIATKIGVQRGLVAAHIRKWRRDGFLLGSHASPSLSLFSCGLLAAEFPIASSQNAVKMMDRLELVDGIISAKAWTGSDISFECCAGYSVASAEQWLPGELSTSSVNRIP